MDGIDQWDLIRWRGQVASTIKGKRGQAFLLEMWKAMDALPSPRLIANELHNEYDGAVCAIGSVGKAQGVDMSNLDPEDYENIARAFGISPQLAQEIMYLNDEVSRGEHVVAYGPPQRYHYTREVYVFVPTTPEERFARMKEWIESNLLPVEA
jgi:hypothetical protein